MKFGIDRLVADAARRRPLGGNRAALHAHPASVTQRRARRPRPLTQCPRGHTARQKIMPLLHQLPPIIATITASKGNKLAAWRAG